MGHADKRQAFLAGEEREGYLPGGLGANAEAWVFSSSGGFSLRRVLGSSSVKGAPLPWTGTSILPGSRDRGIGVSADIHVQER